MASEATTFWPSAALSGRSACFPCLLRGTLRRNAERASARSSSARVTQASGSVGSLIQYTPLGDDFAYEGIALYQGLDNFVRCLD
jgi:hypothetical protein